MNRKRLLVGGALTLAIVVTSASVAWSRPVPPDGASSSPDPPDTTGIAGPIGPQQISPVAAYFKRVTYSSDELGQYQETAAQLPAGRYLVEVLTPQTAGTPDCLGVSFPLRPPRAPGAPYTGYVTVAKGGDAVTVTCYEQAGDTTSTATYELYFLPAPP